MNPNYCFIVPGLYNSGPQHWQTHWENKYGFTRINQQNWDTPNCEDWIKTLDETITNTKHPIEEIILIAHSLACCTIAHWATTYQRPIKAALLVAPSDVEAPSYPLGTKGFAPMPLKKLPFTSLVISSSNDEYVTLQRATYFASCWQSQFVNMGDLGHINGESNLGDWQNGFNALEQLTNKI